MTSCLGGQLHVMQLLCLWKLDLLPLSEAVVGQEKHLEDSPLHGHCGPAYAHLSASWSSTIVQNFSSASRISCKFTPTMFVTFVTSARKQLVVTSARKHLVLLGARVDRRTKFGIFPVPTALWDIRAVHNSIMPLSVGGSLQRKRPSLVALICEKEHTEVFLHWFAVSSGVVAFSC